MSYTKVKYNDYSAYLKSKGIIKTCYVPVNTCPITCDVVNSDLTINGDLTVNGIISGEQINIGNNLRTENIILDSKKNLELQIGGDCFVKLDSSGIHLKKDVISSSNGITLIKDNNNNNQSSRLYGEIITVLDISGINIPHISSDTIEFSLDYNSGFPNGIIYSNSDASSNLYYNNGSGILIIDVSNNKNHFIDSFFEIYVTLDVMSGSPNTSIQSHFDLSGVNSYNRFTIDTRSYQIKQPGNVISATYGPKNFLTGSDGILNDTYKLVGHIETDKDNVLLTGIRTILKQRIL